MSLAVLSRAACASMSTTTTTTTTRDRRDRYGPMELGPTRQSEITTSPLLGASIPGRVILVSKHAVSIARLTLNTLSTKKSIHTGLLCSISQKYTWRAKELMFEKITTSTKPEVHNISQQKVWWNLISGFWYMYADTQANILIVILCIIYWQTTELEATMQTDLKSSIHIRTNRKKDVATRKRLLFNVD